jgi:hypothetical protein
MKTLEQFLALHSLNEGTLKNITIIGIAEEDDSLWLVFEYKKHNYKIDLGKVTWSNLEIMYKTYVWSEMLSQGYLMINIEGGSIVIAPGGQHHQLSDKGCTCESFTFTKKICKHMIFREADLSYRGRQVEALSYIGTNI